MALPAIADVARHFAPAPLIAAAGRRRSVPMVPGIDSVLVLE
jgi:hypothetical protein